MSRDRPFDLLYEFARERGIIGDESGNAESSSDRKKMNGNSQRGGQT